MAIRFRKSVKLFPGVRLNFSGGGVSTTIGVRGASINLGKRAAHLNVGIPGSGLSYRTRLLPTSATPPDPTDRSISPFQPVRPELAPTVVPQALEGEIRSAEISSLTSAGLGEFKRLINEATLRRVTLSKSVSERERELIETERQLKNAQRFLIRLFLQKRAARLAGAAHANKLSLEEARTDLEACSINVDFALDHATLDAFAAMVRIFEDLSRSVKIWDITSAVEIQRARDRTLASEALTRTSVQLGLASSEIIDSAYHALRFPNANGDDICIYPGFVMTQSKNGDFSLIDVRELEVTIRGTRFVEEEAVPPDSEVVGETWKKTNKDGSPDKRFADNYTIPVVKYGQLWFTSPTGLNEAYMFSSFARAEGFAASFANYQRRLQELARTSRVSAADVQPDVDTSVDEVPDAAIVPALPVFAPKWLFLDWIALFAIGCAVIVIAFLALPLFNPREPAKVVIAEPFLTPPDRPIVKEAPPVARPQPKGQKAAPEPSEGPRPLSLSPPPTKSTREVIFVQKANVNLRSSPSPSAAIVAVIGRGKQFTVFGREGDWVQVGEATPTGWIHNTMLAPTAPLSP
jgi:hypothetical protein